MPPSEDALDIEELLTGADELATTLNELDAATDELCELTEELASLIAVLETAAVELLLVIGAPPHALRQAIVAAAVKYCNFIRTPHC